MSLDLKGWGGPSSCRGGEERGVSVLSSELLQASLLQWAHTEVITLPTKRKKEISPQALSHRWGPGAFTPCGIVLVYSEWPRLRSEWAACVHSYHHCRILFPTRYWCSVYEQANISVILGDRRESHYMWLRPAHIPVPVLTNSYLCRHGGISLPLISRCLCWPIDSSAVTAVSASFCCCSVFLFLPFLSSLRAYSITLLTILQDCVCLCVFVWYVSVSVCMCLSVCMYAWGSQNSSLNINFMVLFIGKKVPHYLGICWLGYSSWPMISKNKTSLVK